MSDAATRFIRKLTLEQKHHAQVAEEFTSDLRLAAQRFEKRVVLADKKASSMRPILSTLHLEEQAAIARALA